MNKNNKTDINSSIKTVYENIDKYINGLKSKKKLEEIKELANRFNSLDTYHQVAILEEMLVPFEKKMKKEEESQGWEVCVKEGHIWNLWQEDSREEKRIYCPPDITDYSDPQRGEEYWASVPIWKRKCSRCGFEEEREYRDVPEEVKELRKKQAAEKKEKARINKIEKNKQMIKKLQEENNKLENQ